MQGTPENMQQNPQYGDVVEDIKEWLEDDLDGIAKLIVPIRKAKTIKITTNSISYLVKYFFNNFWPFDYKACINLN